jgi:hypothetical protein
MQKSVVNSKMNTTKDGELISLVHKSTPVSESSASGAVVLGIGGFSSKANSSNEHYYKFFGENDGEINLYKIDYRKCTLHIIPDNSKPYWKEISEFNILRNGQEVLNERLKDEAEYHLYIHKDSIQNYIKIEVE